ncbi:MAG: PDZ domain-containing protein, partial [Tomitella sp.]|nr:PDZ domain-containing protein [Tomitella sp.]
IEDALRVARSILSGETTDTVHVGPTAILGVHVRTRRAEPPVGAEIVSVLPRTPAATAGFEAVDVITAVNERRISGADDLSATIDGSAPGDTIDVRWVDVAGNVFTSPVTLDEGLPR